MLKLSVREWIIVAVALGLASGWWWDRRALSARQRQTHEELITAEMRSGMLEELCEANGYDVNQDSQGLSFKRRPQFTPEVRSEDIAADPEYASEWQQPKTPKAVRAQSLDDLFPDGRSDRRRLFIDNGEKMDP